MKSVFHQTDLAELINRIEKLSPETKPLWGKMDASKMLAHCNVTYEMIYENIHPKPNGFMRFILKLLIKPTVVTDKPYKHNSQTAPEFIISSDKDFNTEKARLIEYMNRTLAHGEAYFEGKESRSFGKLNISEWNNMLYKHLDHHLSQFGV
jgi:hypothetical protein